MGQGNSSAKRPAQNVSVKQSYSAETSQVDYDSKAGNAHSTSASNAIETTIGNTAYSDNLEKNSNLDDKQNPLATVTMTQLPVYTRGAQTKVSAFSTGAAVNPESNLRFPVSSSPAVGEIDPNSFDIDTSQDESSSVRDSDFGDRSETSSQGGGDNESGNGGRSNAEGNVGGRTAASRNSIVIDPVSSLELNTRMTVDDFELLKVLGKGSFGKVMLVKRKGRLYALKSLQKAKLVQRNQLHHTATERIVLQTLHCPFLVHLQYAFQTKDKLYMVLDYVGGGELFFWLKKGKRFSEDRCALYCAEISLALQCMHDADIVYRDLKPENILLDSKGHLKLTDFGLAKGGVTSMDGSMGTKTFCGTPEYLAPEILENRGHGKAVDWWALGTLLYEMLTGLPPYYDSNTQKMYRMILTDPLTFPKAANRQVTLAAKIILTGFLQRKISARLGTDGITQSFCDHEFFKNHGIHFEQVYRLEITPKFKPPVNLEDESDVSNFDEEFTREAATDSLVTSAMTDTMEKKSVFQNFTYKPSAEASLK